MGFGGGAAGAEHADKLGNAGSASDFFQARNGAAFGSLPYVKMGYEKMKSSRAMLVLEPVGVVLILIATTACLVDGSFNPFLYFRF